jgi:hypothetical protein
MGRVVGTAVGATTLISREVNGLPSPPVRPAVGVFSPGCGRVMYPIRSCRDAEDFGLGE